MRHLMFSAFGLALAFGAFGSPTRLTSLNSQANPVQQHIVCLQQQAQDHQQQVAEILDQISVQSAQITPHS